MGWGGGGTVRRTPPLCFFALKKSSGNPYLKILDFFQLFIADAHMKKKFQKFSFTPAHFWDTQYTNILNFFALIKKIFIQSLVEIVFRDHHRV